MIIISTVSLFPNDAVSNDVRIQKRVLESEQGIETEIFASIVHPSLKREVIDEARFRKRIADPKNLLIYHHSVYWEKVLSIYHDAKCPIILRYHNITPESFFAPFDRHTQKMVRLGRAQLQPLIESTKNSAYLSASPYNRDELLALGADPQRSFVLAPFHRLDEIAQAAASQPSRQAKSDLGNAKVRALFVGRLAPNKGFHLQFEVLERFIQLYGDGIRLSFIGAANPGFMLYYRHLEALIEAKGLGDHIEFLQQLSFSELVSRYLESDVFLCLSEHEGFCVPILEAQTCGLPVVALNRAAVQDTLGPGQICFDEFDPSTFAVAIERLRSDQNLRSAVVEQGRRNVQRFGLDQLAVGLKDVIQAFI